MGFSPSNHVLALDAPQTVPLFRLRARDPCPEQHPTEGPTLEPPVIPFTTSPTPTCQWLDSQSTFSLVPTMMS